MTVSAIHTFRHSSVNSISTSNDYRHRKRQISSLMSSAQEGPYEEFEAVGTTPTCDIYRLQGLGVRDI
jgi:hypothetical protein